MIGFFNILKPVGYSSGNVVAAVRRFLLSGGFIDKTVKVGHTGTLDPGGSGVLPIAVGKATRLFDYMTDKTKVYRAEFTFGTETDTLDSYGKITARCDVVPQRDELLRAARELCGTYLQTPPKYSAKSVGGTRAYDLARKGEDFTLKQAEITVYSIDLISYCDNRAVFDIKCGGGTYIRSLCRDIAAKTGTLAYMSYIIRLQSGPFTIENSLSLCELTVEKILPCEFALPLPYIDDLSGKDAFYLNNGIPREVVYPNGFYYVRQDGLVRGIAEEKDGILEFRTRL